MIMTNETVMATAFGWQRNSAAVPRRACIPGFASKSTRPMKGGASIEGASASRGVAEGVARVVHSPSEFGKLKKGDILVSAYTSPAWMPLFRVASAVVTERGSAISHAAIVSREYGIPCVVAAPNVTTLLKDGQTIRVDGTNGTITLLKGVKGGPSYA